MPSCTHNHIHTPWPVAGALVICPGERMCQYCTGADTKRDHGSAQMPRKHVYWEHTDGGRLDYGAVEVVMYRPWQTRPRKPRKRDERGKYLPRDSPDRSSGDEEPENGAETDGEFAEAEIDDEGGMAMAASLSALGASRALEQSKPSPKIQLKGSRPVSKPADIDTQKAQSLFSSGSGEAVRQARKRE